MRENPRSEQTFDQDEILTSVVGGKKEKGESKAEAKVPICFSPSPPPPLLLLLLLFLFCFVLFLVLACWWTVFLDIFSFLSLLDGDGNRKRGNSFRDPLLGLLLLLLLFISLAVVIRCVHLGDTVSFFLSFVCLQSRSLFLLALLPRSLPRRFVFCCVFASVCGSFVLSPR